MKMTKFPKCGMAIIIVLAYVWAYLPTLNSLIVQWDADPNYSHGYLIPVLSLGLLWFTLKGRVPKHFEPSYTLGFSLLLFSTLLRLVGAYYYITPLESLSLLLSIVALILVFAGKAWLARTWQSVALLIFTIPIPNSLGGNQISIELQKIATIMSTFALETLGIVAFRDGNSILLKSCELQVVEACSGLRMLMVFCALAACTAVVLPAGWITKVILMGSAIPLAILCNILRITIAGIASDSLGTRAGHFIFHDLAGWLMVPGAFLLFGAEIFLLSKLLRPVKN